MRALSNGQQGEGVIRAVPNTKCFECFEYEADGTTAIVEFVYTSQLEAPLTSVRLTCAALNILRGQSSARTPCVHLSILNSTKTSE